jgi:hypothetical protein
LRNLLIGIPCGAKESRASEIHESLQYAVVSQSNDLAILQRSRRPGIYALEIEAGWKTVSRRHTHPCERTVASRWPFVASFALRIASASSGVIASVIYRNVADFTNSSWTGRVTSTFVRDYYSAEKESDASSYRAHVDEKLPEGLLTSPSVQIPEGVIHGARRKMNDTLLWTDPTNTPGMDGSQEGEVRSRRNDGTHHRSCGSATR